MAITTNQIYDANRDVYLERERYEREREMQLYRMKEEDYLRQQNNASPYGQALFGQSAHHQGGMLGQSQIFQGQLGQEQSQKPKHDPKSPLAFLNKPDNKLLLTGETL